MNQNQTFNLNTDLMSDGFIGIFIKLVFAIIIVYVIIMVLNFLRDKFIHKEEHTKHEDILGLVTILNKLFFVSGFGFILANILQFIFNQMGRNRNFHSMVLTKNWEYLTFGVILIFVGIAFKAGKKVMKKDAMA
ncbi:hypothetical protein [Echinicola salinicaeni]|uniref:hypothetical protein n=1 Tax=Echinicola salinicaeni TaxID=2762757 RepID=UPI0016442B01|nr:hypothetical protein [Echinicola salinicaeni]